MNTPVYDYLKSYSDSDMLRMHMPGHKGKGSGSVLSDILKLDITEITDAGNLFEDSGIISESEKNASDIFRTAATMYSVQGSTLCIQAMLALMKYENRSVIAIRNTHRAFLSACTLLDIDPVWVFPEYKDTIISGRVDFSVIEEKLRITPNACVYITSPDYLGVMADIKSLAELCHAYGAVLLVDNAHGACLPFYSENKHPIHLGADMCCDSAHKMLPALTGAAYLHIGNPRYVSGAKEAMQLFASTSPSYLIMCSLDLCNVFLKNSIRQRLSEAEKLMADLRRGIGKKYVLECPAFDVEPLHFTINAARSGIKGTLLAERLRADGIECEFADDTYVVLLFSPVDDSGVYEKVAMALEKTESDNYSCSRRLFFPEPLRIMSIRSAALSPHEEIPTENAVGRICASVTVPCPPAVPVVVSGELISEEAAAIMKDFGIQTVKAVITDKKRNGLI